MFEIEDNILLKYNGNDKTVFIPDNVEIIFPNAFLDCDKVEKIIGNNVKSFYCNSKFIAPNNLKELHLPNFQEDFNLEDKNKLNLLIINTNAKINDKIILNSNLKLELITEKESSTYKNDKSLFTDLFESEDDIDELNNNFFAVYIDKDKKVFATKKEINSFLLLVLCLIERWLYFLPQELKDIVFNSGYSFCIINDRLIANGKNVGGIIIEETKQILIDSNQIIYCFLHEFAHAVDIELKISSTLEFIELFELEKNKIYSETAFSRSLNSDFIEPFKKDPSEFFAECFNRCYGNDNSILQECPETCEYIKKIEDKFSKKYIKKHQ